MADMGTHAETVAWLCGQLRELDQLRLEAAGHHGADMLGLEQIDAHRGWLEHQIDMLEAGRMEPARYE